MGKLSIAGLLLLPAVLAVSQPRAQSLQHERTLVLFGASWCAPCIAEVRDIASLASAVRPGRILIAWADDGIGRIRFERPENVELASPQQARSMAAVHRAGFAGYPYAVMLDEKGRKCAQWRGQLTLEVVAEMRGNCRDAPR